LKELILSFKRIGLVVKRNHTAAAETYHRLVPFLRVRYVKLFLDSHSAETLSHDTQITVTSLEEMGRQCDLIIIIGGDGTLLQAARSLSVYEVRILGINLGRLGFLTDLNPQHIESHLEPILAGKFHEERRFLLRAIVYRDDEVLHHAWGFNDVLLQKWNTAYMMSFTVTIDGQLLGHQRADGLLLSTPTGSTAYCLSAGGPILQPDVDAITLLSICPHTLSNPAMILNGNSQVEITLLPSQGDNVQLMCDAVPQQLLQAGDCIHIQKHRHIWLVHPCNHDHFATLRNKLHWGKEP
jgi:NAD+ kinase